MQPATLAGIPGAAEVRSRRRSEAVREYRGTFAFRSQHEPAIVQLFESRDRVEFESRLDGVPVRLAVILTDLSLEIGFAFFQGEEAAGDLVGNAGA